MADRSFLFLLGSSRNGGNTEALARLAAEQLPSGAGQRWLHLGEHPLPDFEDVRHEGDGSYPAPTGHAATLLDATLEATDLVIASPLYWYSVSTSTKRYLDHWSGWMRVPGVGFKDRMAGRTLWGVTALAGSEETADPLVGTLRHTAAYMGMAFGGVLLGNGTRPGDVARDTTAAARAKTFFTS
ncbi:flavodoxin family protein [Streptomyces sp. NPDC059909]|uniref:flavodoxin family protein n=1 Tax=Streptomyces sp. NPDC059909 TaxID=3346998 RepID=UPI003668E7D6